VVIEEYASIDHEKIVRYTQEKLVQVYTIESIEVLKRGISRRLDKLLEFESNDLLKESEGILLFLQSNISNLTVRRSNLDTMIESAQELIISDESFVTNLMSRKYDVNPSIFGVADVEVKKDILQGNIVFLEKVLRRLEKAKLEKKLIAKIIKRIPIIKRQIIQWDDIKTYDSYSDKTEIKLIERTEQIYYENGIFKKFLSHAFGMGLFGYVKPKTFMSLMSTLTQVPKKELENYTFDADIGKRFPEKDEKTKLPILGKVVWVDTFYNVKLKGSVDAVINMTQSLVIIEKHTKQGGDRDQLARAMYNLYNTHIFEADELTEIILEYIGDDVYYNIKGLATHELFKNPPDWLKNLIGEDGEVMGKKVRIKQESNLKKDIIKEKHQIKKQFLKLNYGKKRNMTDPIQNQIFEKSFNAYLDGNFSRLNKGIDLTILDGLVNSVRAL